MSREGNDIQLRYILAPISFIYGIAVRLRNKLFDWGILSSEQYTIPIICVGNLAVGGTGKTPHTEYLVRLLKKEWKVAVLSRGYKRKSSGFLLLDELTSTSQEAGDEPCQMKRKFPEALVAVDTNRRRGIGKLLALPPEKRPEIILLDDAYQHRYVSPSLSVVLTDYNRLYFYDKLLPFGMLREPADCISRADAIIVTKCPSNLKPIDYRIIEENMKLFAHQQLFFSKICYGNIEPVFPSVARVLLPGKIKKDNGFLLVAGIASPHLFFNEGEKYSDKTIKVAFPDHHIFKKRDFKSLQKALDTMEATNKYILITEKDAERMKCNPNFPETWKKITYYLPITVEFFPNNKFDSLITKHIHTTNKNNILR